MPRSWQIIETRAQQTQGVWALSGAFTVRGKTKTDHNELITALQAAAVSQETAQNAMDTTIGALEVEYTFFGSMNSAIYQRLDSEVPDTDPLQRDVDQIGRIRPSNRAAIEERTLKTIAAWKKVNAERGVAFPVLPPVTVRGTSVTDYEDRFNLLAATKPEREMAASSWRKENSLLRAATRALDLLNKDWYQAWKSEFPPDTPEGEALIGVDTGEGTPPPQVLEIDAVTQEGLSLNVTYLPDTGAHATVLELLWQVEGVHTDYQRTPADPEGGNVIGPFTEGQVVRVRTDVGNSRDYSELSAETVVTIASAG